MKRITSFLKMSKTNSSERKHFCAKLCKFFFLFYRFHEPFLVQYFNATRYGNTANVLFLLARFLANMLILSAELIKCDLWFRRDSLKSDLKSHFHVKQIFSSRLLGLDNLQTAGPRQRL